VIKHFSACTVLATQNQTKLGELEESVFASLRDSINGEDVQTMSIDEDRLTKLEAILLRISLLSMSRDIASVMEDEEGGQSSGWDIVCAFAERGEVGYKEEAKVSRTGDSLLLTVACGIRHPDHLPARDLAVQAFAGGRPRQRQSRCTSGEEEQGQGCLP